MFKHVVEELRKERRIEEIKGVRSGNVVGLHWRMCVRSMEIQLHKKEGGRLIHSAGGRVITPSSL